MVNPNTILTLVQGGKRLGGSVKQLANAFRKRQAQDKIAKNTIAVKSAPKPKISKPVVAKPDNKLSKFAQKKTQQFNKKPILPNPTKPNMSMGGFNVGNQLNTFKKKQNQAIGKGLSNPVNYEQKIKNIMGVN